jgi:hypothetical protein
MMPGMSLHDVQARIVDPNGKICIEGVPSEEFLICSDHRSLCMKMCASSSTAGRLR